MLKWINKKRNKKGFTLVELVVVIAILGILAAIAVPRLSGFREGAQTSANKATAAVIAKAAELYDSTNEVDPGAAEGDINLLITAGLIEGKEGDFENFDLKYDGRYYVEHDSVVLYPEGFEPENNINP